MLGEKRSQSLFAPKASAEKAAATHITTGPDGRKKELPLYFGPDCPVSGNMGQNQHEAGVGEPQPADEPLRHAPADDGTGVEADPTDSVNMAEDLPRRSLNTESAGGYRAHSLFFTPENEGQDFNTVLQDVQEYISGKYSALITEGGDEDAKAQIKRYITKYVQDRRIAVKGYSGDQLVDALYTEMAEFGLLTKYIFGTGIEEINVNSWRDIEVLYANGETVKLEEHFDSPEHAVNVIRRMLHVSGMVLDNASPAVLGHLSKNIRIAVLKTPLVDEDVGVTASIRIVNPQNMQKKDFVKGGTATGPMLDFLAACLRYGVSVCVAGATGSGKTTVAGWLLTTIPDNKRIFTIENGSRELDLVREKDGRVCNSVIHTITRESENAKQNIDQDMLLDMALRYHPDIICVGEMRSAEAYAAQEAARTGHGVLTTIHSNSSQATWRRMVTLCKRKHEMADDIIKQGDDRLYSFKIEPTTGGSFFRMLTEDLRLNTRLLDTFLPLIKAHYLDFIDRFEVDPAEALQPVCAPFIQPGDYSWCIHVREQMVERYGTAEQLAEYRRQAELRGTPEHKAKNWMGSMLFHLSHANDVDHAWASSRTREELDQVVEPFVQAKRQAGQWTQEDEAGYQLYRQETDRRSAPFGYGISSPTPAACRKSLSRKSWSFGGNCSQKRRRKPNEQ